MSLDEILEEFQCIICTEYLFPPFQECSIGHIFCPNCTEKLEHCPLCRSQIVYKKNYVLEDLFSKIDFPCKYSSEGCKFRGKSSKVKEHEILCQFRPTNQEEEGFLATRCENFFYFFDCSMLGSFLLIVTCFFYLSLMPETPSYLVDGASLLPHEEVKNDLVHLLE